MGNNNNKNTIKKLIESNAAVQKKVAELKITVDQLLEKPDFNALYAKWKAENQAIPDIPPVVVDQEPEPPVVTPPEPTTTPTPEPTPTGDVIFDSHRDTKLHNSQVRTVKTEGNVTAGGLGCECHASGDPRMVVNNDGTFSLVANGPGHGRFYVYALNYNSTLEIEAAFWNEAAGQDLSLKTRSRHNEGGDGTNRFGGYGLAIDRSNWDAKREIWHNEHDESASGALPVKPETKKYFTIRFTVKDDGAGKVIQTGEMDGKKFMTKTDSSPKPYMVDQASFAKQSYFWVRQNLDSGTGEIRIKQLRLLKA